MMKIKDKFKRKDRFHIDLPPPDLKTIIERAIMNIDTKSIVDNYGKYHIMIDYKYIDFSYTKYPDYLYRYQGPDFMDGGRIARSTHND